MVLPSKANHINLVSSTPPFCGYFAVKLPNPHPVLHPPLAVTCDLVSSIPSTVTPPCYFLPFSAAILCTVIWVPNDSRMRRIRIREKWADTLCSGRYSYSLVTKVLLGRPEVSPSKALSLSLLCCDSMVCRTFNLLPTLPIMSPWAQSLCWSQKLFYHGARNLYSHTSTASWPPG